MAVVHSTAVVCAIATSLQLFSKVDLQTVLKAARWSSGGGGGNVYFILLARQVSKQTVYTFISVMSYELFVIICNTIEFSGEKLNSVKIIG